MTNEILKVAKQYKRRLRKKQVNVESTIEYLNKIGYTVCFYDDTKGQNLLREYNLLTYSEKAYALTYSTRNHKLVFVSDKISQEEKLCAILHETGHILLHHLEKCDSVQNNQMSEVQADTFAQFVLSPPKQPIKAYISIALVSAVATGAVSAFLSFHIISQTNYIPGTQATPTATTQPLSADLVYITKTGTRYHRSDCIYTKDKDCISITREEAEKQYTPCSICRP